MWRHSFVVTTVALGGEVDEALAALAGSDANANAPDLETATAEIVRLLYGAHRKARIATLARAVRDIVLALDEGTLR